MRAGECFAEALVLVSFFLADLWIFERTLSLCGKARLTKFSVTPADLRSLMLFLVVLGGEV